MSHLSFPLHSATFHWGDVHAQCTYAYRGIYCVTSKYNQRAKRPDPRRGTGRRSVQGVCGRIVYARNSIEDDEEDRSVS